MKYATFHTAALKSPYMEGRWGRSVTTRPKLRLLLKINHTKLSDSTVTEYTSSGAQRAFKYKMTTNPI